MALRNIQTEGGMKEKIPTDSYLLLLPLLIVGWIDKIRA